VPCILGAPDQVSDDEVPIPHLHATPPSPPSARAAATLLADSDDEVPLLRFSPRTALLSCCGDAVVPFPHPIICCLSSSASSPIVRPQPALQAGSLGRCPLGYG
jgi:hypothetical protein